MLSRQAIERSTYIVTVSFFDQTNTPIVPLDVVWTLTDDAGSVINQRKQVSITPDTSIVIVLHGDDLALPNSRTRRVLSIEAHYNSTAGNNLEFNSQEEFLIVPLTALPIGE